MNKLHPRTTTLWRYAGLLGAALVTVMVAAGEALVLSPQGVTFLAPGGLTAIVGVVSLSHALIWPTLRYRFWRWGVDDDRVIIERGVVWRHRHLIPRVRIQHVDTRTSPLQRWYGLSSLIIYTAGTRGADAEIPGLAAEEAEQLREELARLEELDERA